MNIENIEILTDLLFLLKNALTLLLVRHQIIEQVKANQHQLIHTLNTLLRNHYGENIKDVILFGSQAKETANEFSDYDVLIILKNQYDWKYRKQINHTIFDLELKHEVLFDTHLLSEYELENTLKGAEPIYQNALKQGIYA